MNTKAIALVVVAILVGLAVLLVVTKSAAQAGGGDTLIYARSADSTTLDPQEMEWGEDVKVAENIFETLVRFGAEPPKVEPLLATSWETSTDGLVWTFRLREGVGFHDGTEFDSAAVDFAFRRMLDESFSYRPQKSVYADFYREVIATIGTPDPLTVTFTLKRPSAVFLQLLAIFPAGIPSPAAVKEHGGEFPRHPVGTGPFHLAEWKTKEKIVLLRNEEYWGEKPALARLIYEPVTNPQTAIEKLKNGECHMMDHLAPDDVRTIEADAELRVAFATSPNVAYLAFNMSPEAFPYNNIHFRRAVSYALDRAVLVNLVYFDQAVPARNIVPPTLWGDAAELPPYERDLEKAKKELGEVALPEGFVAELWHQNFGRDYMQHPERVAEFVKDQLAKIGLAVKIQSFEKASYTAKTKERSHPMCLLGWMADYPDPDNFMNPLLHGQFAGDLNISFFDHAEFNGLVSEAASISDWEKRKPLYEAAARIYREELPSLALVHTGRIFAMRKEVKYRPHPIDYRIYDAALEELAGK